MSEPGPVSSSGTPADDDVCPRCNGRGREMNAEVQIGAPSCLACFGTGKKENPMTASNECSEPNPDGRAPCCRPLGHHVLTEHWNGTDSWPHQPGPTSPSGTPADERRGLTLRQAAVEAILIREQDTAFSVVEPTMHVIRRADGEEMGDYAFFATDGPDGWDVADCTDHDEDTVYEILACYPVSRRKFLCSTLCETCDGEGDGCPACAGSGECEPPDAEHMPIVARPAPSSSPVGDRGLDDLRVELAVTQAALHQACHDGWSDAHGAMAGYLSDARAAAADREEPT